MIVGIPKESFPGERSVALVPAVVSLLTKAGAEVVIEGGAGQAAGYPDASYAEAGARVEGSIIRDSIIHDDAVVEDALLEASVVGNRATVIGRRARLNVGDSTELDFN